MLSRRRLAAAAALVLAAAMPLARAAEPVPPAVPIDDGRDDVTVVAVVDDGFTPYHWDFLSSKMPQHKDANPANNLPLNEAPDTWVSGFPAGGAGFKSYNRLDVSRNDTTASASTAALATKDAAKWADFEPSTATETNFYWMPGTKIIGAVQFGPGAWLGNNDNHGARSAASAAGNIHGTCPECVFVLIAGLSDDPDTALDWALKQPWIDAVTNSYGNSLVAYDKIHFGKNTELQRTAVERGQSVFFSGGNGFFANAYDAPPITYLSSQKGPDWLTQVGATAPNGGNYTGSGKPVDVASIGASYPSSGGTTVNGVGTHSGTSNATPVTSGLYARALWQARTLLEGPSRSQENGVIARGAPVACGSVRPDCELGDGILTRTELYTRLVEGAIHTPQGPSPAGLVSSPSTTAEHDYLSEGHGTYFARMPGTNGATQWKAEEARIMGPMLGTAATLARPDGEKEWFEVDSYCRQKFWGAWGQGAYKAPAALPGPSQTWPTRSALSTGCQAAQDLRPVPRTPSVIP